MDKIIPTASLSLIPIPLGARESAMLDSLGRLLNSVCCVLLC